MTEQERNTERLKAYGKLVESWILSATAGVPADIVSTQLDRLEERQGEDGVQLSEIFGEREDGPHCFISERPDFDLRIDDAGDIALINFEHAISYAWPRKPFVSLGEGVEWAKNYSLKHRMHSYRVTKETNDN